MEKDRTGILQGKTIPFPTFDLVVKPLLGLLGSTQGKVQAEDDAAQQDAEALAQEDRARSHESGEKRREFQARFELAKAFQEVEKIGKEITPALKKAMLAEDVAALLDAYHAAVTRVKATNRKAEVIA